MFIYSPTEVSLCMMAGFFGGGMPLKGKSRCSVYMSDKPSQCIAVPLSIIAKLAA